MVSTLLAHDLLWGMTPQQLPADAPAWVIESISAGQPVVVRRALSAAGQVAVGVRGPLREQRFAAVMEVAAITRRVQAGRAVPCSRRARFPGAACLGATALAPRWQWLGLGCQRQRRVRVGQWVCRFARGQRPRPDPAYATSVESCHAQALVAILDTAVCRVDMQLQTPSGAVALREWAGASSRVLLKNASQASLVTDPWNPQEQAA